MELRYFGRRSSRIFEYAPEPKVGSHSKNRFRSMIREIWNIIISSLPYLSFSDTDEATLKGIFHLKKYGSSERRSI